MARIDWNREITFGRKKKDASRGRAGGPSAGALRAPKNAGGVRRAGRGRLPTKRSINLAQVGVETIDPRAAMAGIALIVIAAFLFGKFFVADRLAAMFRADRETARLQQALDLEYEKIASYDGLEDDYAHYTFSGMTEEELSLVDRPAVIRMVENELGVHGAADSWSLAGNVLTLTVTGADLQEINLLARRLETYDIVNMCAVTNATKEEWKDSGASYAVRAAQAARASRAATAREAEDGGNGAGENAYDGLTFVRANIIAYLQTAGEGEGAGAEAAGTPATDAP